MRIVGLTGSIGMGKTTTARMFAVRGVPVHDADATVHRLYRGAAVAPIADAFPGVVEGGVIDRARLAARVVDKAEALALLEAIVHPLVLESERAFVAKAKAEARRMVLLDIPLLFETNAVRRVDTIVVVTADPKVQRERVLARPGMTEARFDALLSRQVADAEKRKQAHFLVDSGHGIESARRAVDAILAALAFAL
jgi:dephospho-CoA kinase